MIHALAEVDVTKARRVICEHKARTGESVFYGIHHRLLGAGGR